MIAGPHGFPMGWRELRAQIVDVSKFKPGSGDPFSLKGTLAPDTQ